MHNNAFKNIFWFFRGQKEYINNTPKIEKIRQKYTNQMTSSQRNHQINVKKSNFFLCRNLDPPPAIRNATQPGSIVHASGEVGEISGRRVPTVIHASVNMITITSTCPSWAVSCLRLRPHPHPFTSPNPIRLYHFRDIFYACDRYYYYYTPARQYFTFNLRNEKEIRDD